MRGGLVVLALCAAVAAATARAASAPLRHLPGWDDSAAAWSPDGRSILYGRAYEPPKDSNDFRLAVVAADGAWARPLGYRTPGDEPEKWDFPGAWSPDGRHVAFTRELGLRADHVLVVDADGRNQRDLTGDAGGDEFGANWSPDGSRLAFTRQTEDLGTWELWTMRPDGGARQRVVTGGWVNEPIWSPDGTEIAFARFGPSSRAALTGIWVVRPDGAGERRITTKADDRPLDWSADGTQLLVERGRNAGKPSLWLVRLDGSPKRLADGSSGSFSPGGRLIVFDRGSVGGDAARPAVFVIRADGSGLRPIARGLVGPRWSPDGLSLAATGSGPCLNSGVYRIELASRAARRLTSDCRITGTPRADVLRGTSERDVIRGLDGNDTILANPGDRAPVYYGRVDADFVDAGPGNDRVYAGRGQDVVLGGPGADRLYGGRGPDRLSGGRGDDVLDGGRYHDVLRGGAGNDLIHARDGFGDRVSCGAGRDTVRADRADVVARDCEHVIRS